jgi:ATP-dependent DNA helicase RecQ
MNQSPIDILRQYWHHDAFRPQQEEIILSILAGKDTIALLPTGGGKSACFQIPALAMPGLCLVISPLVALMKDQVDQLRKKNITAFALNSGMTRKELINTLQVAGDSNCKFLYVSPERLETKIFAEYLPGLPISLVAVDEAHCVSQWGYDFRPSYLRIAALREWLPATPVLALTASATPDVLKDMSDKLGLRQPAIFRRPFTRPNLSYSVFNVESKMRKIMEILQNVPGSSIVYCRSRRETREISAALNRQGISAEPYHAGLTREERSQRQEAWLKDRLRVIVCTNAFGMGIDHPGVRSVIHAGIPDAVENYYQESGRAGRDGKRAYAVLLYGEKEPDALKTMPDLRFPTIDSIRRVYQNVMNYLQLPAGSGEGNYYDFDMTGFLDKFQSAGQDSGASEVLNSIRVLEQEGLMSFQQQVFLPSRLQFITGKPSLHDFEQAHPELEPLIHGLLRTYEGIFDQPVPIYEKGLALALRKDLTTIITGLQQLRSWNIIDYTPQKESPQLYFFRDRPNAGELYIDPVNYRARKEQYAARIRAMLEWLEMKKGCRSRGLAGYFGDEEGADCGICDNCLRSRAKPFPPKVV